MLLQVFSYFITRAGSLRVLKCWWFVFCCRRRRRRGVELLIGSRPLITWPDWFVALWHI